MKIYDLKNLPVYPYAEREKNIFYNAEEFKSRIIKLSPGEQLPECKMSTHVIFYVVQGEAEIIVNNNKAKIEEGQCLITEPATISMRTEKGARIMGIQIKKL
ncbi:cupin domain-containing protein [Desulfurobacterium sp.]